MMGKNNKKGNKPSVFKVAGAKSLKKTKAKAVNLGLKNIKQKVGELDKQFLETKKASNSVSVSPIAKVQELNKKIEKKISKDDVAKAAMEMNKMDL